MSKNFAGHFLFKKLEISRDEDNKLADISNLVIEINLNAFVTEPSFNAIFTMLDSTDFISKFPIRGGQNINFEIQYGDEIRIYTMVIIAVSDIANAEEGQTYAIKCGSPLLVKSNFSRISKHFEGAVSKIAKDIFEQHANKEKENIRFWDDSINSESIIIPDWSPIISLLWLAKRAKSKISNTRFFFFQNTYGEYNFLPLERLKTISEETPQMFVFNQNKIGVNNKSDKDMNSIESYTVNASYNLLDTAENGYLSGEIFQYNMTSKSTNTIEHKLEHNKKDVDNELPLWGGFKPSGMGRKIDKINALNDDLGESINKTLDVSSILQTQYQRSNNILSITIPGNNVTDIGQIIDIRIPLAAPKQKEGIDNKNLSGKYLTVAKRHIFSPSTSSMVLDCIRDSNIIGAEE